MYYAEIRDAIFNDRQAPIPARDIVAGMAILETSFESGTRGQALPIPLTPGELALWKI
jgi:hypothetical protein